MHKIILGMGILFISILYLISLDISLDKQPTSTLDSIYLAHKISKIAKCDNKFSMLFDVFESSGDKGYSYGCMIGDAGFTIETFPDDKLKENAIKQFKEQNISSRLYIPCFKEGAYYIICQSLTLPNKKLGIPKLYPHLYKQFPGEPLEYNRK